jgi:hypothetical protein
VAHLRDVKPILLEHCSRWHGPRKQQAVLRLDTAWNILEGSNSGPVLQPGRSQDSLLYKANSGHKDVRAMPPKGPRLARVQVASVRNWIDQGARVPASETTVSTGNTSKHWAFLAPVTEDRVHVHDLQATILHLLGLDHKKLTFRFQGRDFRLTDVSGAVVKKLLA